MIDLSTVPVRLAPIRTDAGQIHLIRANSKYAECVAQAGKLAFDSVKPWMGNSLVPTTPRTAKLLLDALEKQRDIGYGVCYLLIWQQQCLGMGILNYIHPVHRNANLGLWLIPEARGKGVAFTLCQRLIDLATHPLKLNRLEYLTLPDNIASIKLAKALGAQQEGLCRRRVFGEDALLFSILI
ncbi:GNAT family N-acetyltransferase [Aestuariibacter sp. GS-14]|uniref:GNAT family N-acetyltransferase n=1 Tax=Alteromonadaceae TaxID=72275 RepID=UPI00112C9CD9|nr:GNAT family N-acetyltransferase [Aestuariibacter sp. GS-14]TPV60703.1 GNAT family N-acetyltransferase [Aestuariibacter sp. GS-14]